MNGGCICGAGVIIDKPAALPTLPTRVREALRTLERDGLVVTRPHRGTFVRRVTKREAHERYTLGMELESFAARLGPAPAGGGPLSPLRGDVGDVGGGGGR